MLKIIAFSLSMLLSEVAYVKPLESTETERLAELCKVWGKIKIFNPKASTNPGLWDTALMHAIPLVRNALNNEEINSAYGVMLNALGDPHSRTIYPSSRQARTLRSLSIDSTSERFVRVAIGSMENLSASRLLPYLRRHAFKKQLVLDLRADVSDLEDLAVEDSLKRLLESMYARWDVELPSKRRITYFGYQTQLTSGSKLYSKIYSYEPASVLDFSGKLELSRPIILILNEGSIGTTRLLAGLHAVKLARVIVELKPPRETGVELFTGILSTGARYTFSTTENGFKNGNSADYIDTVVTTISDDRGSDDLLTHFRASNYWRSPQISNYPAWKEVTYENAPVVDSVNLRLLSLFRMWNVVEYFFPYKHLMDVPWDRTLTDMIPKYIEATTETAFHDAMLETNARLQDDHVGTGHESIIKQIGLRALPIGLRYLNRELVVDRIDSTSDALGKIGLGDRITMIDGVTIDSLRARYSRLISATTPQGRDNKLLLRILRSNLPTKRLAVLSPSGTAREIELKTYEEMLPWKEDQSPIYRKLDDELNAYYIDLCRLTVPKVKEAYAEAKSSDYLVLDMRGYPRQTIWALSPLLAKSPNIVARYRMLRLSHPDSVAASWESEVEQLRPQRGKGYDGKIIVLINDQAISQSEHTCLFLKAMGNTTFIGTPTRGTNGDVTNTVLPGGYGVNFTGLYVGYPDGSELQRRGIIPDVVSEPTPEDIRDGRDAVLERAVQFIKADRFAKQRK